jgi:hypothetical protein
MLKKFMTALLAFCAAAVFAAEPTASHRAAAIEYLEAKGTPQLLDNTCRTILAKQIAIQPQLAEHREKLLAFYRRALGFEALKDDLAAIYAREYTEEELRELIRFYRSPVGKKSVAVEEKLVPEFAALLERKIREAAAAFGK